MIHFVPPSFVIGAIIIWYSTIASIPSNWHLCDGTHGTPNLRNRFIRGAQDEEHVGATGGQDSQTHTFTGDGHTHNLPEIPPRVIAPGGTYAATTDPTAATGTTDSAENRPLFHSLAYIQRIA